MASQLTYGFAAETSLGYSSSQLTTSTDNEAHTMHLGAVSAPSAGCTSSPFPKAHYRWASNHDDSYTGNALQSISPSGTAEATQTITQLIEFVPLSKGVLHSQNGIAKATQRNSSSRFET